MATDYAELEREFLASLAADSGRDLAAWMALIDAQKLNHRNDIIDWLRQQGFMFARASWLERIHHNGGRPVYLAALPGSTPPAAASGASFPSRRPLPRGAEAGVAASPAQDHASTPASAEPPARSPPPDTQVPPPPVPRAFPGARSDVQELLTRGKAYRILAEHVLAKLAAELPDAEVMAISGCICFSLDHPVAVLAVSARDVRLGLALTPVPLHQGFEAGRPIGAPLAITQTIALTDARQVTPELLALVRRAADPS